MASSHPRSFLRSGAQEAHQSSCILLDAALERCGGAPSDLDASAAPSRACCDFEIKHLTQACWACTTNDASCASATRDADIALGMSICARTPSTPPSLLLHSSHQLHLRGAETASDVHTGAPTASLTSRLPPATLFLVTFFAVLSILAVGVFSIVVHRCRKARPYEKRAKRQAFVDLMEGLTPVEERRSSTPDPCNPWVQFQPDFPAVEPPPRARTPTPQMLEVPRGPGLVRHATLSSPPPVFVAPQRRTSR